MKNFSDILHSTFYILDFMVSLVIVTHGDFGAYLLEAAEEIVGRQPGQGIFIAPISRKLTLAEVRQKIEAALAGALGAAGPDGALILCDMLGGTPCNEALMIARHHPNVEVLAGINLYMVVSAMMNARRLGLPALAQKVLEDSKRSVANAKELFLGKQRA
ncbi:MAG: hypothetical protein HY747_04275 [Elusimicrobia bacterium]|nr:hypothetical protein [Elusimicrobiota bacterium]